MLLLGRAGPATGPALMLRLRSHRRDRDRQSGLDITHALLLAKVAAEAMEFCCSYCGLKGVSRPAS
jgi:hypothetical protein